MAVVQGGMTRRRLMKLGWMWGCLLLAGMMGARSEVSRAAAPQQAAPNWALAISTYPVGAKIMRSGPATNADMQQVFGHFHMVSYDGLQRLNDRGWLQIVQWAKKTTSNHKTTTHQLIWEYGISQYPTEALGQAAIEDIFQEMGSYSQGGPYGRMVTFDHGGYHYVFIALGERTITGEMLCSIRAKDAHTYRARLRTYCLRHATTLAPIIATAAIPTPTPTPTNTPTPTTTPTPTNTPTPTDTPTPTPTRTLVPTRTPIPTWTPRPTWTPIPISVPYQYPTPTDIPLPVYNPPPVTYPPPGGGLNCEGDGDNDDKGLPAGANDKDLNCHPFIHVVPSTGTVILGASEPDGDRTEARLTIRQWNRQVRNTARRLFGCAYRTLTVRQQRHVVESVLQRHLVWHRDSS